MYCSAYEINDQNSDTRFFFVLRRSNISKFLQRSHVVIKRTGRESTPNKDKFYVGV